MNCPIIGIKSVPEDIQRVWIQNKSFNNNPPYEYNCIRKAKNKPYFEYFKFLSNDGNIPSNFKPNNIHKLVTFEDSSKLGLIVDSQFSKIEQSLRNQKLLLKSINKNSKI